MIIEIEYYKGDTLLFGKVKNTAELKKQLDNIEASYDRSADNFIELLCRNYQWTVLETYEKSDYVYDRDIGKLIKK
ncbi:MAG: hypothetical protein J1E40_02745 [Oscillospiraceae bacterium]|nr:hypothetical protein [Oscillospiraceae bacterium]